MAQRVLMSMTVTTSDGEQQWISKIHNFAEALKPGGAVVVRLLRTVLVFGLLQRIRQRFMANLRLAMEMSVAGASLDERFREKVTGGRSVAKLELAYKKLDSAVMSASSKRITKAQAEVDRAVSSALNTMAKQQESVLKKRMSLSQRSRETAGKLNYLQRKAGMVDLGLGAVAGGLFRQRAMMVLELMTAATSISAVSVSDQGTTIGAGNMNAVESVITPSATQSLMGVQSRSTRRVLWRQLEFGTGVYAKKQPGVSTASSPYTRGDKWLYGYKDKRTDSDRGVYAFGTQPMNFLFPQGVSGPKRFDARDRAAAAQVLGEFMQFIAPLPQYAIFL